MSHPKFWMYSGLSLLAMSIMVIDTIAKQRQFYTTVVVLVSSKVSRVLITNTSFVLIALCGQFIKWAFFGTLKPREIEKIHENTFYYVATTCLALTIFRENMNSTILMMFVMCMFLKIFHWLVQSRQEYIEQSLEHGDDRSQHTRLFVFLLLLMTVDVVMSIVYTSHLLSFGFSVRLLLALEFLVMAVSCGTTTIKLCFHVVDGYYQHRWENKGKFRFYLEIAHDLLHCTLYIVFFGLLLAFYGIPLHLTRELYLTLRSFKKTVEDFLRYRKLTACLDTRFADATPEEMQRDPQCIICYDDMVNSAKKLSCGHIFHKHCLKSWMERNNKCPLCNKPSLQLEPLPPVVRARPAPQAIVQQHPLPQPVHQQTQPPPQPSAYEQQQNQQRQIVMQAYLRIQQDNHLRATTAASNSPLQNVFGVSNLNVHSFAPSILSATPSVDSVPLMPMLNPQAAEAFAEYQKRMGEYHENMAKACRELADKLLRSSASAAASSSSDT
jgi:E3 ubiquitin-protein ligase synoviolin